MVETDECFLNQDDDEDENTDQTLELEEDQNKESKDQSPKKVPPAAKISRENGKICEYYNTKGYYKLVILKD